MKNMILVIIAVIVIVGAVVVFNRGNQDITTPEEWNGNMPSRNEEVDVAPEIVVRYSDSGFSPSAITVKSGSKVTFINQGPGLMWPASAPHPTHTILPSLDAKQGIPVGESYSYTFDQVGTWAYHNHLRPQNTGRVIVEPN